jgi:hypothetical protein
MYVSGPSVQMRYDINIQKVVRVYGQDDYETAVLDNLPHKEFIDEVNDLFRQGRAALLDVTEYDENGMSQQTIGVYVGEATPYFPPIRRLVVTVKDPDFGPTKCSKCGIMHNHGTHMCPYQVEVNSDAKTQCDCCSDCEQNCVDAI